MKIAFTIVTANYLAQAKTLSNSLLKYNPNYQFKIILLDKILDRFDVEYFAPAEIIEIEEIGIVGFNEMLERYTLFELSNALKPFVADYFLSNLSFTFILYFDSDTFIFNDFSNVNTLLESNSILITPHLFSSTPDDGLTINDKSFLLHGIYNGGFFALKNDSFAIEFIKWWKNKLRLECLVDYTSGLYVDQKWLNLVPVFFKKVNVISHLGFNMGYWNMHERRIEKIENTYVINKIYNLVFFHFSGYDVKYPDIISKHQIRYSFQNRPDIVEIFSTYKAVIEENSFSKFSILQCYYAKHSLVKVESFSNLRKIKKMLRYKLNQLISRKHF